MLQLSAKTWLVCVAVVGGAVRAGEPLHRRIDALILAQANGKPAAPAAADGEFLRRVYLDLAGRIPSVAEARTFFADQAADKRTAVIDRLLAGPEYPRRMQEVFHVMFMERMGDNPEWARFLRSSFEANKPWDQLVREILNPIAGGAAKGADYFYAKRLEKYGQNPTDYPGLTRDVGRLFLGMDLQCAQCHDHRFISDYRQKDFQGLYAIFANMQLVGTKSVGEKVMTSKLTYASVFNKVQKEIGPRIPGLPEFEIPALKKGEEFAVKPDSKTKTPGIPKFSPLAKLSERLPTAETKAFVRNSVNRLWFVMMGRGIVHPLDLHHRENPPSHPELLDALADGFVAHKFDVRWLLREIALSQAYQRSGVMPAGAEEPAPESFLVALEKRMSAEQLLWSTLEATGGDAKAADALKTKFVRAFAGPAREAEVEFAPSLKAALFVLNDDAVVALFAAKPGNLIDRLGTLADDKVADELYLAVLTRLPTAAEKAETAAYLAKNAARRPTALGNLAWALAASTEFCVNH